MIPYKNGIPKNHLLGATPDEISRFINKKWVEVHDHLGNTEDRYKQNKQIRFKTSIPKSDLCNFSDAYIVAKGRVTVEGGSNNSKKIDL